MESTSEISEVLFILLVRPPCRCVAPLMNEMHSYFGVESITSVVYFLEALVQLRRPPAPDGLALAKLSLMVINSKDISYEYSYWLGDKHSYQKIDK